MTRKGRWSGRLTPRHLQKRLSKHGSDYAAGRVGRWALERLTKGEQERIVRIVLDWVRYFEFAQRTFPDIRAVRATYNQFGLRCPCLEDHRCGHGQCRVCDDRPTSKYPTAFDDVCDH